MRLADAFPIPQDRARPAITRGQAFARAFLNVWCHWPVQRMTYTAWRTTALPAVNRLREMACGQTK